MRRPASCVAPDATFVTAPTRRPRVWLVGLLGARLGTVLPAATCAPAPTCAAEPLYCGGTDAVTCPDGQACDRTDALCTLASPAGRCAVLPATCSDASPVRGCDGTTYASDCARLQAGVVRAHDGACDPPPVACGNNGVLRPAGEFCEFVPGDCGEGQLGACRPQRAEPCDLCLAYLPGPVCGCDFHTYASDCEREAAGVSKIFNGPCGF